MTNMEITIGHPTNRPNFTIVTINELELFFSYETCVAFRDYRDGYESGLFVTENQWGPTTGKHLNYVDPDRTHRCDPVTFAAKLEKATR